MQIARVPTHPVLNIHDSREVIWPYCETGPAAQGARRALWPHLYQRKDCLMDDVARFANSRKIQ